MKYDVIIIGAGIAGSTLGYLLKKKNKKVLIIEREDINKKDKLCGGLLSIKSYNLFNEIYKNNNLKFKEFKEFTVNNNGEKIPFYHNFYSIDRKELDNYAIKEYIKSNGELLDNIKEYDIDFNTNTITINKKEYKYDYLVGADGVFSNLRKKVTGKIQNRSLAYEIRTKKSDNLELHFINKFNGYGWIIPNNNSTMVGVGDTIATKDKEKYLDKFLENINVEKKNVRGAYLPTGNDIFLRKDNIYFVGDAAGFIIPITGEGIYYAMLSSKILSDSFDNYEYECINIMNKIKKIKKVEKVIYSTTVRNYVFKHHNNKKIKETIERFLISVA